MLTYTQAFIIGALQGITELFPISSLGHTVLIPSLLHMGIDQNADFFIVFLVATHLATALVLLGFYYKDWLMLLGGFFRSMRALKIPKDDVYARLVWLLILATIPAGLIGLVFQHKLEALFAAPSMVALFLVANGVLLYGAELLRKRKTETNAHGTGEDTAIAKLTWPKALGVGLMQMLALFPGFSRTGASLAGGLLAGLDREAAMRFSFLLATPIILAAAVLKLPKLILAPHDYPVGPILLGALVSAIAAYLSVRFLTKYFKSNTLTPFAIYCVVAGIISYTILNLF